MPRYAFILNKKKQTSEILIDFRGFVYVIGNYSAMFLLHRNASEKEYKKAIN